jgi:DNA mismatch repair protein MutS2
LADFGILLRLIRHAIDEQGRVRDHASQALSEIRRELWRLRDRIQRQLQAVMAAQKAVVQDAIVTMRNDRFVIPLKADARRMVGGIVHGESASGATVYVEPEQVVELNNQLLHTQAEEERAIRAVLRELTVRVAAQRAPLDQALQLVGEIDVVCAKGHLSLRMRGAAPQFSLDTRLELREARHPLLTAPIPIDIHIEPERRTLVITGPNTGGKTAVLKTLGLLVLMAQSGLHIPASPDSVLPIYTDLFVDIGDEQSLQQNLSTFAAHLANICSMLPQLSSQVLVLLDELGAGTDPMEGGDLGVALLETFQQSGATTVVTTHHSTIKTFAMTTPSIACAAVQFDLATLQPRYRLTYGLPGQSQAFAIAEKLGVPLSIIERAQRETTMTQRRSDQLLASLECQRQTLEIEQQRLQQERVDIERMQQTAQRLLAEAQAEETRVRQRLYTEGQALLKTARKELDGTLADLRRQMPAGSRVAFPQEVWERAAQTVTSFAVEAPEVSATPQPLQVGEQVRIRQLNIVGRVAAEAASNGTLQVAVGTKTFTVPAVDLERVSESETETPAKRAVTVRRAQRRHAVADLSIAPELRLMGMTVDEALPAVEQHIDRACRCGMSQVRLVHGIGRGRLRDAIAEVLRHHPLVIRFHPGDGEGRMTIVELERCEA